MSQSGWPKVLADLQVKIGRHNFATWLKNSELLSLTDEEAVISVDKPYAKTWVEKNALKDIHHFLAEQKPNLKTVEIVIKTVENSETPMPLLEAIEPKSEQKSNKTETINPCLDKYTFDTFIVGNSNRLAFAASEAVAERPGEAYNPLFIYGGVGLGKTHLMHAVGNAVWNQDKSKNIIYTSCETFTNEFVSALQNKNINKFKHKYRTVDLFLIDDIQFLASKEGTQEEFFHTFNILHQSNRQIIIASDRVPKDIPGLEERLSSRFGWGMIADIQTPNLETRMAILQAKAQEKNATVPKEVIEYIANHVTANIRELEGALTKLLGSAKLTNQPITVEFTEHALADILKLDKKKPITAKKLIQIIAKYFNLETVDLLGSSRVKSLIYPRQLLMYLMRSRLGLSFNQIGEYFGGKDHTTIMHTFNKIEATRQVEPNAKHLEEIEKMFYE